MTTTAPCLNPRCDGHGWVTVLPSYAPQHHPIPVALLGQLDDDLAGAVKAASSPMANDDARLRQRITAAADPAVARSLVVHVASREALAEAMYPCKDCNEDSFLRWCGGHFDPRHDRAGCPDCNPKAARTSKSEPTSSRPSMPERRDLA